MKVFYIDRGATVDHVSRLVCDLSARQWLVLVKQIVAFLQIFISPSLFIHRSSLPLESSCGGCTLLLGSLRMLYTVN